MESSLDSLNTFTLNTLSALCLYQKHQSHKIANLNFRVEEEHRRNTRTVIFRSPFTQRSGEIILITAPHPRAHGALDTALWRCGQTQCPSLPLLLNEQRGRALLAAAVRGDPRPACAQPQRRWSKEPATRKTSPQRVSAASLATALPGPEQFPMRAAVFDLDAALSEAATRGTEVSAPAAL
jgi:hypothetical protein